MLEAIAKRLFGSANDRFLNGLSKDVEAINALEPSMEALSDEELAVRTPWLKERLNDGEDLDDLLVDAFATVREAAKRTLGERVLVRLRVDSILPVRSEGHESEP